jgi:hypothetical protein
MHSLLHSQLALTSADNIAAAASRRTLRVRRRMPNPLAALITADPPVAGDPAMTYQAAATPARIDEPGDAPSTSPAPGAAA